MDEATIHRPEEVAKSIYRLTASCTWLVAAPSGYDLRALLRGGASDEELSAAIAARWERRSDRYSELRSSQTVGLSRVEMSYIGG